MGPKHVLVTGASGFIGRPLVLALVRAGYRVRAATRRPISFPSAVEIAIVPDFTRPIDWTPILRGIDVVIHAAGLAHADLPDMAFGAFDHINWIATSNLARAAAQAGVERFIFISSIRAQVGPSASGIVTERGETYPTDHYGRSKLAAETAVRASGVPFTILRPVVVYGPHPKGNFKILFRLALLPLPLPVAALNNRRSILGIDNLISAILFVLDNSTSVGERYIVADPKPFSIRELLTMLRTALGRRPRLVYFPPKLLKVALLLINHIHVWERLGGELIVDTSKLESIGWRPVVETYDGLRAALLAENSDLSSEGNGQDAQG